MPNRDRTTEVQLPRPKPGQAWDESTIRAALTAMLRGKTRWPTYQEFVGAGAKGLRDAVNRFGGPERWAREMGVAGGGRPRGGVVRWTDERVRSTLEPFLAGRDRWPSRQEFDAAGLAGLREALRYHGGTDLWAAEFGLTRTSRFPSRPRPRASVAKRNDWPRWTEERIRRELQNFTRDKKRWPRYRDFLQNGRRPLYRAVLAHGGIERWAAELNLALPRERSQYATEDELRRGLASFLADRSSWPPQRAFEAAGERRLLAAVRRFGGVDRWSTEMGLQRGTGRLWDDERIEREIGPLVRDLGRWPTKGEFKRAGLAKALAAVYTHGGSRRWQRHFGVRPLPSTHPIPHRRARRG